MNKLKKVTALMLCCAFMISTLTSCSEPNESSSAAEAESAPEASSVSEETPSDSKAAPVEVPHSDKFTVNDGKVTFTDFFGKETTLTINPKRVVTLTNNFHDLWYDCGGTAVGRVDEPLTSLRSEEAKAVDIVGSVNQVSLENVLAKEPDLVIIKCRDKTHQEMLPTFESAGIEYLAWDYETFEGFLETLELYCTLTGHPELYEKWAVDNIQRVTAVRDICAKQTPADIVLLIPSANKGMQALNTTGYLGNVLTDLNTVNVAFADGLNEGQRGFPISMEKLVELDPKFILSRGGSGDGTEESARAIFETNPLWFELTAVKEDRYHHLPSDLFLYKANVRYGEAYEYLAKILYPDAF